MILMYHHVAPIDAVPGTAAPIEGWHLRLSPAEFEGQLRRLLDRGYRFVPLPELVEEIKSRGAERARLAAISFDDGWRDNFTYAFPVLRQLRLPATFFVTSEHLRRGLEDSRRMNVEQLRQLVHAGMEIGGHSRTHPNLALLSEADAAEEIAGCKQDLEVALGTPIKLFAHPFGAHNPTTVRLIREAGFVAACSAWGSATNTSSSLYWLYRDMFTPELNTRADRHALSPVRRRTVALKRELRNKVVAVLRPLWKRHRARLTGK